MSGSTTSFLFNGQPVPPQPTSSDTSTAYPLWLQQMTANIGNAATNLAQTPFTNFPGQQVATPSAATQQSWQMAQNNVGNYGGALANANTALGNAATPISSADINQYMNPYMSSVIGGLQSAANTNLTQNQLPAIESQFVGAGQAASPQMQQADNNALYQSNQALDQATAGALGTGYQGALSAAQQQKALQGTVGAEYGQMGALTQQLGAGDVGQIAASGAAQDTTNQANINAAMNNFYAQQQWPYQNLGYASNIIRGLPVGTNTQTVGTQYVNNPYTASPLAAFTGTLLGANSLSNNNSNNSNNSSSMGLKRGGRVRKRFADGGSSEPAVAA